MLDFIPWLLPVSMGLHNLRSRMARSLLTMLGITLGVAVVLAIDITNKSTLDSIQETFARPWRPGAYLPTLWGVDFAFSR